MNFTPTLSPKQLLEQSNGRCWYCGDAITKETFSRDHVIPKAWGGDRRGNLVPCCKACNNLKGDRTLETFRQHLTRQRTGAPHFNNKQRNWLRTKGFPIDDYPLVTFWFEALGLELPGRWKESV